MAKTKRTVEEAEEAAAANSDSKLITQSKLSHFATKFWDKIKTRYDGTFKNASISDSNDSVKKLTFTKTDGKTHDVDLRDYVRLQDKNDFKQDVSSNVGMTDGTLKLGSINGTENIGRISGYRSITTKQFVDNYVSYLSVLTDESLVAGSSSSWTVWAVEKKTNRNDDVVYNKYESTVTVKEKNIGSNSYRYVDLIIDDKFDNKEIYFIVGCNDLTKGHKVIRLKDEYKNENAVNVRTRPAVGGGIAWETAKDNIAIMVIHGRESIASLSEKLNKVSPDSGLYVKHSETTNAGGATNAGMVVKLDNDGKLNKDMLPSIAINEYFEIAAFNHATLQSQRYENGDVAVVNGTGKRYLCINKDKNPDNLTEGFIELNDKDGVVTGVNDKTGAVVLNLEATENSLKLTIGNGTGAPVEKNVPIVTEGDINSIIEGLRD